MRKCYNCGTKEEPDKDLLRPYGPNDSDVCINCVNSNPEIRNAAKKNFLDRELNAQKATGISLLTKEGPIPFLRNIKK